MSIYVLKRNSKEKSFYIKNAIFNSNDLFLIYYNNISKLFGLYKIKKANKNKQYSCSFDKIKNYRRGLDLNDLYYNNIRFNFKKSSCIKISKSRFNKIIDRLELKNFPQGVTDYLFLRLKDNNIEINYIQNHPDIIHIKKRLNFNNRNFKTLNLLIDGLINKIINFYNINNELNELKNRIENTFFKDFKIFDKITERFISIKTDAELSRIPFEIYLLNKKNNFYTSRIVDIERINIGNKLKFPSGVKFVYPEYKKHALPCSNEKNTICRKLKNYNYEIYCKSFKPAEFIKLLEDSYIMHFSGHSVYNNKQKEYGLRINDNDIFYFSDFKQCLNLPDMITFNSCFEFKHIEHLSPSLKILFQLGCKNIILPFTEIWGEQPVFFPHIYKHISDGLEIGKAFKYVMDSFKGRLKFYPLLFRLYGNPMEKYFKKY